MRNLKVHLQYLGSQCDVCSDLHVKSGVCVMKHLYGAVYGDSCHPGSRGNGAHHTPVHAHQNGAGQLACWHIFWAFLHAVICILGSTVKFAKDIPNSHSYSNGQL